MIFFAARQGYFFRSGTWYTYGVIFSGLVLAVTINYYCCIIFLSLSVPTLILIIGLLSSS